MNKFTILHFNFHSILVKFTKLASYLSQYFSRNIEKTIDNLTQILHSK